MPSRYLIEKIDGILYNIRETVEVLPLAEAVEWLDKLKEKDAVVVKKDKREQHSLIFIGTTKAYLRTREVIKSKPMTKSASDPKDFVFADKNLILIGRYDKLLLYSIRSVLINGREYSDYLVIMTDFDGVFRYLFKIEKRTKDIRKWELGILKGDYIERSKLKNRFNKFQRALYFGEKSEVISRFKLIEIVDFLRGLTDGQGKTK